MLRFVRWSVWLWTAVLTAAVVAPVWAQQPQEKGMRPGPGGGQPGMHRPGGPMGILMIPQVQEELKLTPEQMQKIDGIYEDARKEMEEQRAAGGGQEMWAKHAERSAAMGAKIKEVLTPAQYERSRQIGMQMAGPAAFADPEVLKDLALTDQQKAEIENVQAQLHQKMREMYEKARSEASQGQGGPTGEHWKQFSQMRADTMQALLNVLTPEQKQKWEKMKGQKFELDMSKMGGPRGGAPMGPQ